MQVVANVVIVVAVLVAVLTAVVGHRANKARSSAPVVEQQAERPAVTRIDAPRQRSASVDPEPRTATAAGR